MRLRGSSSEERESFQRMIEVAFIAAAFAFAAMATAYWYTQIVRGDYYFKLSENNRLRSVAVTAARGVIYDRHGVPLAENEPSYTLYLYRRETKNLAASIDTAVSLLGLPREDVERRVARYRTYFDFVPIALAENLTIGEVAAIEARGAEDPEFAVGVGQRRLYTKGTGAQAIGYLSEASPNQIAAQPDRYRPGVAIGQRGIESAYQDLLAGRDGERRIIVDSFGHETAEESREDPVPGRNLTLTIDERLQEVAERYFQNRVGSAVAMDPKTGQILAMISAPSYDPNLFSRRMTGTQWATLVDNPFRPLQNRAIQNVYSPGSAFKVFLAVEGLAGGYITPDTKVFCPGYATFYGRAFKCHKKEGHGWVNLREAIRGSCDVYFYTLGKRMGIEKIAEAARAFGFGKPTGLDLPNEKAGLVPSEEWSEKVRKAHWYPSETISVAIGQGPLLVTSLQLARGLAGLVNGGRFPRPHLFLSAQDAQTGGRFEYFDGTEERMKIDPAIVGQVEDAMWAVVNEPGGTAYLSRLPGLDLCGKTGSVQVVAQKDTKKEGSLPFEKRDHAWFIGFAPRRDPKIVIAVFVEHGQHGASAAAPLARDLAATYLGVPIPHPAEPGEPPAGAPAPTTIAAARAAASLPAPARKAAPITEARR
ncbi:MAG TPA: penicillin-binding protein 2 [Thermoanaerobaculia bacterium]|nr:penicillin-binding protein 2 [Thermoanaerobaculia bacterium]